MLFAVCTITVGVITIDVITIGTIHIIPVGTMHIIPNASAEQDTICTQDDVANSDIPYSHSSIQTSEGAQVIGSDVLNSMGYMGKGIKVAVIDTGFDVFNPEIAGNIITYQSFFEPNRDIQGKSTFTARHGTGVAEIIVDVAPCVELYLYNFNTNIEFYNLIDHIISRGDIDIISMSLGWYNDAGPADGTNDFAKKVNEARDNGILFVISAGNAAEQHWQGRFSDPDGNGIHNFDDNDEALEIYLQRGVPISIRLSWNDWPTSYQDYDLVLSGRDFGETILLTDSRNYQRGNNAPLEAFYYIPQSSMYGYISIIKADATEKADFKLFVLDPYRLGENSIAESSILIPADADGSFSVGAVHWESHELESYSSQGPTLDGRIKPDIVAPTHVSTTAYNYPFRGTSAAVPHVTGAAALIMEKYPNATIDDVRAILEATVYDRDTKTNQDGAGMVDVSMLANSDILALDNSNPDCDPCFFPKMTEITGDGITWVNTDNFPIIITGNNTAGSFESDILERGVTYSMIPATGITNYYDMLHTWATGQILVEKPNRPVLLSAILTGPNKIEVKFSESVHAVSSDFTDVQLDQGYRQVISLEGSGSSLLTISLGGQPIPSDATGTMDIGGKITNISGISFESINDYIISDGQSPRITSAKLVESNVIRMSFSESVHVMSSDFTDLDISPGGDKNITSISGSGSTDILIHFDGITSTDATATINAGSGIVDFAGNRLVPVYDYVVSDAQMPVLLSVSISSSNIDSSIAIPGDEIIISFTASEEITITGVEINGSTVSAVSQDNISWIITDIITDANSVGTDVTFAINYSDTSSNAGDVVTLTTDGSMVRVMYDITSSISGTVFSDINWNGVQDAGEPGYSGYTMYAIDRVTGIQTSTVTDIDGRYSFDVIPGNDILVQTHFFPQGHVVFDSYTSWYMYTEVLAGQTVIFDVGFHPVTLDEQVTLNLVVYLDENFNGVYDADERTVGGLDYFCIYTYTIGYVGCPTFDDTGRASVNDLVPADFAVLVDVDMLADAGYV
ncbi:MAG: S8 family serine peptidase, partial [Thaumarchaeota archaeon]|nr:S8 family serine peptidase [Nitrososphaerota archaeon]